jgi:hypothetical protein
MERNLTRDVKLAGVRLGANPHICAFFHSQNEEYQLMLPFIQEGIAGGEKAFHIVAPTLRQQHQQRLNEVGIDTEALQTAGQLEIRVWDEAYLRSNGAFDQEDMLVLIQEVLSSAKNEGYPLTRLVAHMEWALENRDGVSDLLEYETRLNLVLEGSEDPVICVYDLAKFSAVTVMDILRTHPMVILGGTVQVNPFYVPPEEFLKEIQARNG